MSPTPTTTQPVLLAFTAGVVAHDDLAIVKAGTSTLRLAVTENDDGEDLTIVSVTQPPVGAVSIADNQLVIEVPDGVSVRDMEFSYRVENSRGDAASARVQLVESSLNVELEHADLGAAEFFGDRVAETTMDGRRLVPALPPIADVFRDLRLPIPSTTRVAILTVLALLVLFRLRRTRSFVAVENRDRGSSDEASPFRLRHNAAGIWATGRRSLRRDQVEIEVPSGRQWVDRETIVDHFDPH